MMTAEQNYQLLQEIDANRRFMLLAYRSNPALLAGAEESIRRLFDPMPESAPRPGIETPPQGNRTNVRRAASTDS